MQENKTRDFNPLDILATAAALKCVDKRKSGETVDMTQHKDSLEEEQKSETSEDTDKRNKVSSQNVVRKLKLVTVCSDLEKMFDEHNYGNSRKSNKGSGSWSADITPSGKDRKVIVTVVDRSGDHRVVKTFNSIKVSKNAGKAVQASESDKNITPAAGEKIKISCSEQSIDNSGDNCTSSQGNNSNKVNVNKEENLPDQVDLFTCSKQITSNANDSLEGHSQNTVDSGLIHNTSACQSRIDSTAGNRSSSEVSICSEIDRQKNVYKEENILEPEGKSEEQQFVDHKFDIDSDSDISKSTGKSEGHFHQNIENLSEKEISNSDSCESLDSQDTKLQTESDPQSVNSVKTNTHTDSVILTGNGSQVRVISSQIEKGDDLTQPQKFIINISKNSVSTLPELNTEKGVNFLCNSTESDGEQIDTVKEVIGDKCLNKTQNSQDSDKTLDVKLSEKTTSHNCDRQVEKNELVMSPLGIDSVPVGCSSCFRHFEDTSDSESWRNDGVPGRSDVRLSLDLDSPKSEGLENLSSVEEGSCNTLPKYDSECDSHQKFSDTTDNMVNETSSESDILGQQTSETKNFPDTLPLSIDKQNNEINTYVDTGDHCYAGVSYASKQEKAQVSFHHDESLSTDSLCDLSQDSGFGEVGHLPNLSETDGKQKEMSLIQKDNYEKSTPDVFVKSSDTSIPAILEVHNSNKLYDNRGISSPKDTVITVLKSSENTYLQSSALHSHMSPNTSVSFNKKETSPTFGKYCIGTFASVSNLAVGLESSNQTPQIIGVQKLNTSTKLAATSLLTNAVYKNQNLPLHMTPVKSGESLLTEKINGSQHTKQVLDRIWKNHIEHDHDYCAQIDLESLGTAKQTKEAITKVKSRRNIDSGDKKLRKCLVLTDSESLDLDSSNDALSLDESSEPASPSVPTISHSHGTRQKLKAEKIADYVKSGCSDSKLKITGSFQDDYIYFLNTKLRSRRRTTSQDLQPAIPPDKIFVPLPKPGDIVVPHLTDADLEAIRQGHPSAAKPTQRCPVSSSPSVNIPNLAISSSQNKNIPNPVSKLATSQVGQPPNGAGSFSDEESKIINTILSMENGESSSSQSSTETFPTDTGLFGNSGESLMNLTPESINLTPEQMEILYSAMDEVQSLSPDVSKVDSKFSLDEQSKDSFSADSVTPQEENKEIKDIHIAENAKGTTDSSMVISTTSTDVSSKSDTEALSSVPVDTEAKQILTNNVACPGVVSSLPDISFPTLDKSSLDIFGSDLKLFPEASVESTPPNTALAPHSSQSDNSAPWIVTVSMYWNDLPAIMIENLPYVRLVDIHKQILPAKDTGILKKRCQLLGIEVKNCTEMQRYFLVQYGKAFNSKSTLIVGKDCAKSLIGYYVNPSANPNRLKEAKAVDRQVDTYSEDTKAAKSGNIIRSKQVSESSKKPENTELLQEMLKPVKDITQHPSVTAVQLQYMSSPGTKAATGQQPSTRTRHKKINFLEMLKGDSNNNTEVSEEKEINIERGHNSSIVDSTNFKLEKSKNKNVSPAVKDKGKSVQSVEECEKSEKVNKLRTSTDESVQVEISTVESESENRGDGRFGIGSKKRARQIESNAKDKIHITKKLKLDKKKAGPLKVKWTIFNKTNSQKSAGNKDKIEMKQEILAVVHKDMTPRNGHRGRVQAGNIFVNLYDGTHSLCVKCCSCKKMLSVDNFLKHLHETGGSGKLTIVNQPQTLALRDNYPSEFQKKLWENFQKRKKMYSDNVRQQKLEEKKISDKNTIKSLIRLDSVKAVPRDPNVRSSSRKRKPKQLHPIENYSFSKSAVQNCQSDDLASDSHSSFIENNIESEEPSPCKLSKILPNLSAGLETGLIQCEDLSTSSLPSESVVTLTNGPEVISFTALENGFDV